MNKNLKKKINIFKTGTIHVPPKNREISNFLIKVMLNSKLDTLTTL